MRGARFWRPDAVTKLKKCSEFIADACDPIPTDACCAVIPCSYCVTWAPYDGDTSMAVAEFVTDGWYAALGSVDFRGYWERNYETGECEFVVTLNGNEVYRNDCYGGVTCRDASDSAEATIGYDAGTLTWARIEPRPLEYVTDYDTNCRKHFCGVCECSCDCLCVTIAEGYGGAVSRGEICDTSYPCDGPVWAGTVGTYDLSIALGEDEYGNCIVTATVDGDAQSPVSAGGCGAMSATITLADETTITIRCKVCSCDATITPCCSPRCEPLYIGDDLVEYPGACANPLPLTLACDLTATSSLPGYTCFNGSGTLTFRTPASTPSGTFCWEGVISGTCTDCNSNPLDWAVKIVVCCDSITESHTVSMIPEPGSICPAGPLTSDLVTTASCDPLLLSGCFPTFGACMVCFGDSPSFTVCFEIYETP